MGTNNRRAGGKAFTGVLQERMRLRRFGWVCSVGPPGCLVPYQAVGMGAAGRGGSGLVSV